MKEKKHKSVYRVLGSSNHVEHEREHNDYYATPPHAIMELLKREKFKNKIWEPACGEGHISKTLKKNKYIVNSTDLVYRGYGKGDFDFLKCEKKTIRDIITNPPFSLASQFVEHAMKLIRDKGKVALFLKLQFLEGSKRNLMFKKYPPKNIYVFSYRVACALGGDFVKYSMYGGAVCHCWYIWEKGFKGKPSVDWIGK